MFLVSTAFGDGCFIPERAVRKIPDIPAQRALLSWKDGIETLVISSAIESESQKLGWIIPVPSVPKTIEKESQGGLKTLNFCLQPEITHEGLYPWIILSTLAAWIANVIMGTFLFQRRQFIRVLIYVSLFVVFLALLLPALGTAGAALKPANVHVERTVAVGAYDISVLRSPTAGKLNGWLADNGFSTLPATADKIVADYISQGWVFVAIKLTRGEAGANAPHPIKMVFKANEAVYPMKLTAVAGGSPQVELFVVGCDSASCGQLQEEFCDRFTETDSNREGYETRRSFAGTTTHQAIGHPAICSLMWDGCVLTKFAGTISSKDMSSDLRFHWGPFRAFQQHFYTITGARDIALLSVVWFLGGWVFISMIAFNKRIARPGGLKWYFGRSLLPATVLVFIGIGIVVHSLPKLGYSEVQLSRPYWRFSFPNILSDKVDSLFDDRKDILQGTERDIETRLLKALSEKMKPIATITGEALAVEDSPGNFTVEKRHDKIVIRIYDSVGSVRIREYPIHGRSEKKITP